MCGLWEGNGQEVNFVITSSPRREARSTWFLFCNVHHPSNWKLELRIETVHCFLPFITVEKLTHGSKFRLFLFFFCKNSLKFTSCLFSQSKCLNLCCIYLYVRWWKFKKILGGDQYVWRHCFADQSDSSECPTVPGFLDGVYDVCVLYSSCHIFLDIESSFPDSL